MGKTYYIDTAPPVLQCCQNSHPNLFFNTNWEPAVTHTNDVLQLRCGLEYSPQSSFKIFKHTNKYKQPDGSIFYMQMHMPHLYSFDHLGWGVTHSKMFDTSWESEDYFTARDSCEDIRKTWMEYGFSKLSQPPIGDIPFENYLLFTLQMPEDTVLEDFSPVPMIQILCWLESWSRDNKTLIIVKPHPGTAQEFPELLDLFRRIASRHEYFVFSEANIHSLINKSRALITINSGTGFEALIHGKPVITIGRCDYESMTLKVKPFTMESSDVEKFIVEHPHRDDQIKFAYHYIFKRNYWLGQDGSAPIRLARYLEEKVDAFYQNFVDKATGAL